jgi:hypothetical protein
MQTTKPSAHIISTDMVVTAMCLLGESLRHRPYCHRVGVVIGVGVGVGVCAGVDVGVGVGAGVGGSHPFDY